LTDGGASVTNAEGFVYRVDFDLGGNGPHCQCKGFEHTGWCKHLTAAYMVAGKTKGKPEDDEPTDEEWAAMQDDEDRAREYILTPAWTVATWAARLMRWDGR
jgi:uncharacterized Zn finger protein